MLQSQGLNILFQRFVRALRIFVATFSMLFHLELLNAQNWIYYSRNNTSTHNQTIFELEQVLKWFVFVSSQTHIPIKLLVYELIFRLFLDVCNAIFFVQILFWLLLCQEEEEEIRFQRFWCEFRYVDVRYYLWLWVFRIIARKFLFRSFRD